MTDDTPDPQDLAEALDSDELGTADDPSIEPDYPFDRLLGADQFGTTAAEEQLGEPIDERVEREEPDLLAAELAAAEESEERAADRSTVAAALDEIELQMDEDTLSAIDAVDAFDEIDAIDGIDPAAGTEAGRLVEGDLAQEVTDLDVEAQSVATAFEEGDLSAEEAAVHLSGEPPMDAPDDEEM